MKSSTRYLVVGTGLASAGALTLYFAIVKYRDVFAGTYSQNPAEWGLFGDYLGGFAGTLITFLTLLALVVTLYWQAKGLEDQADAISEYEARRIQPLIKCEWLKSKEHKGLDWRIRNVGLGPCILETIELRVDGIKIGEHAASDSSQYALNAWREAIGAYSADLVDCVSLEPAHSLKVGLAAGEPQIMVRLNATNTPKVERIWSEIDQNLQTVVYFRSLTGELLDTETQFERLREPPSKRKVRARRV